MIKGSKFFQGWPQRHDDICQIFCSVYKCSWVVINATLTDPFISSSKSNSGLYSLSSSINSEKSESLSSLLIGLSQSNPTQIHWWCPACYILHVHQCQCVDTTSDIALIWFIHVLVSTIALSRLSVGCGTTPRRQSGYLVGFCLFIRMIYTMPPHGHWLILP